VSIVFVMVNTKPAYDRTSNYWCTRPITGLYNEYMRSAKVHYLIT